MPPRRPFAEPRTERSRRRRDNAFVSEGARTGTVYVAEDFDDEDLTRLTATFSAHWESDEGDGFEPGPEGVSAEEAIAWGRRHADVVLILLGGEDEHFSAGVRQPEGEPFPAWPAGGIEVRPRPIGSPRDVAVVCEVTAGSLSAAVLRLDELVERAAGRAAWVETESWSLD
jgi:hypothetical protein